MHARVLEAFLWDKPSRNHPDDALAIDFFGDGEPAPPSVRPASIRCQVSWPPHRVD